ncbi:Presequence translocated-associated motor subunit PAM17 mitochondrial [Dissostichus eleginoides]|uniref:Presequence translocated-associated motor subunit PAM17 mitochondrial n=1 Tax=Dissostichus eleginoides TaxID=100907 RepID=A0AAD9CCI5_DISEL|nr:Presequence translocated-associated motor subunit PAM17 mitochondrial [Dissostichus eleginoides]
MQRRLLAKSLVDLHKEYNQTCEAHHVISYRQFVRYKPFFVTEARSNDRNTCACYQHENMRLRIDSLSEKGILSSKSLSYLLSSITCNTEDLHCMNRTCTKCCYDEIKLVAYNPDERARWEHWTKEDVVVGNKTYKNWVKKTENGEIYYRDLSCFCQYPEMCECFKPTKMRMDDSSNANSDHLQPDSIQKTYAESPSTDVEKNEEYTVGKFVIVSYDNKLFVGQITKLLLDNIEINCMVQHGKRNVFKWPNKPDCIFYHREQIASVISKPEPNQRAAQLTKYDWLLFNEI